MSRIRARLLQSFAVACARLPPPASPTVVTVSPPPPWAAPEKPAETELPGITLPVAKAAAPREPGTAPTIVVSMAKLELDGQTVGDAHALLQTRRVQRVDGLFQALRRAREADATRDSVVRLAIDVETPSVLVKSVLQTSAFAGFPRVSFLVRALDGKRGSLPIDVVTPGPPSPDATRTEGDGVHLALLPWGVVVGWRRAGRIASRTEVKSPRIGDEMRRAWRPAAELPASSNVYLYARDDLDFRVVVEVIDAIRQAAQDDAAAEPDARPRALSFHFAPQSDFGPEQPREAADPPASASVPFDMGAARTAISAVDVQSCKRADGPLGSGRVKIAFASRGAVESVVLMAGPFKGSSVEACILRKYGAVRISPFTGQPVEVSKSFSIQ